MSAKVYVVDDDRVSAAATAAVIRNHGDYVTETYLHPGDLLRRCDTNPPDAVITDLRMPAIDGIEVTRRLRKTDRFLPIFVLTGHEEIATAVEALKAGANEYLTKPANIDELITLLDRALAERPAKEEVASLMQGRREEYSLEAILGDHAKVNGVRRFVRRIAAVPKSTVLLLGESGTGKNLVAKTIHYASPHAQGRFVEINCTALPSQLLEAELFGYNKGAFTDAREAKRGLIEIADGGTLFLDELGDMPLELQAKLLQFLESRQFRRLGGTEELKVNLRLITATNQNLKDAVQEGRFRADLYYRVSVATHELPPLRAVKTDIPKIADHFRRIFNLEFRKNVDAFTEDAIHTLMNWHWPGNVRELRNVVERSLIFADGPVLSHADLPDFGPHIVVNEVSSENGGFKIPMGLSLAEAEREYIRNTLLHCQSNVQRAAEHLGISRKNLWEKRKKHGLLS